MQKLLHPFYRIPWLFPFIIFTILLLIGANMHPLWEDEAETALFARNIISYGIPMGWDGTNIMGLDNAVVLNKQLINHSSPWAQYYITALSFSLLGESSFAARVPFILFSIAMLPFAYLLVMKITGSKRISFLTVCIMSLSIPLVLFGYQARYYSLTLFAGILFSYFSISIGEKRIVPKIFFVLTGIFFFYANYLLFMAFYLSLFASLLIYFFLRKEKFVFIKNFVMWFFILSFGIAVFTFPWYFSYQPLDTRGAIAISKIFSADGIRLFLQAGAYYNENNAFPVTFCILLCIVIYTYIRRKKNLAPILFAFALPILFLVFMTLFTEISNTNIIFIRSRYTMGIYPYFCFLVAMLLNEIWEWNRIFAGIFFVCYICTSIFTLQLKSFPLAFMQEALHPYSTPDAAVAEYLKKNAKPGDTAFLSLDRDHEPLQFYLQNTIRFVDRVSYDNIRIFPENRKVLPSYIYNYQGEPDWVILYSKRMYDGTYFTDDYRELPPDIYLKRDYKKTVLPIFFSDLSRPEIYVHSFQKITPSYEDQIFIYKKR